MSTYAAYAGRQPLAWWMYLVHRLSGLALAIFLPLHFLLLGSALAGAARLQTLLALTQQPWMRCFEWAIVVALALHLSAGVRILAIEFLNWHAWQKTLSAAALMLTTAFGLAYLLALFG
jgi:fumarate reductase subunit D